MSVGRLQLNGVEPRHFATLAAVEEARSFKLAARRLRCAHSAVSQRVAQLERALGTRLVDRVPGQPVVSLTEAGRLVARHGRGILGQLDAASADLRAHQRGGATLRVGVHDPAMMRVVPPALARLAVDAPAVRIALTDVVASARARARDVQRGVLDAALQDLPSPPGPFASIELLRDPIVLVTRRGTALSDRRELTTLDELDGMPLVADAAQSQLELMRAQLACAGVRPRFVLEARLTSSLQALVAVGIGSALMPLLSVDRRDPRIAVTRLGELLPPRRIGLYWHAQRRRLHPLEPFRDALVEACAELHDAPAVVAAR